MAKNRKNACYALTVDASQLLDQLAKKELRPIPNMAEYLILKAAEKNNIKPLNKTA